MVHGSVHEKKPERFPAFLWSLYQPFHRLPRPSRGEAGSRSGVMVTLA